VTIVRHRPSTQPRLLEVEGATQTVRATTEMDPEIENGADHVFVQDDWAYGCSKPLGQCHGLVATNGGPLVDLDETENGSLSGGAGFECSTSTTSQCSTTGPAVCSICLRRYRVGQVLAWSHNPHCRHVYHEDCITCWIEALMLAPPPSPLSPYLTPHSCPTCRQDFLYRNTPL
jgi:hypothetical protein